MTVELDDIGDRLAVEFEQPVDIASVDARMLGVRHMRRRVFRLNMPTHGVNVSRFRQKRFEIADIIGDLREQSAGELASLAALLRLRLEIDDELFANEQNNRDSGRDDRSENADIHVEPSHPAATPNGAANMPWTRPLNDAVYP